EGIEVFTSSQPPAIAVIGNVVSVTGTVATFPATTASHTPATELTSPTVTLISTGSPLPAPITLDATKLTPSGGLYQLTPYEGMRVSVASMTAISGTNGSITSANEPTETATSTGYFYAVITGTPRPFREPGMAVQPVPLPAANQFTVASFNVERFYNTSSTDDLYYVPAGVTGFNGNSSTGTVSTGQTFTSAAVDVTQAAYTRRLQKVSLAIRTVLNTPDIVTL